jgi:hypothetical protein
MSRTTQVLAFVAALVVMPAIAAAQGNGQRRAYQEHDAATRTTFTATTDAGGNAVLTLKGGDFVLEKVVAPTGDATLRLSQGKDVVTIALSQSGFQVARGQNAIRIDPRSDTEDKIDAVRSVLLGSQAVRSFKRLVALLEDRDEREEDGPLALSALVDGAIVQVLDGDADAARRIAKRITRKQRSGLRTVKGRRAPATFVDCIGSYEFALMSAITQYETCYVDATAYYWWNRLLVYKLCEWEWAIRSQQYVWQFIGCFMFPW